VAKAELVPPMPADAGLDAAVASWADGFDEECVELFVAVFPVTNPNTVDAAAAAGLVITGEASELLVVALQDLDVAVLGSVTISAAAEARLVFSVAM
jgi:hypothetical protein